MKIVKKILNKNKKFSFKLIAKIQINLSKLFTIKENKMIKVRKDQHNFLKQDLKNGMNAKNVLMIRKRLFLKNAQTFQYYLIL